MRSIKRLLLMLLLRLRLGSPLGVLEILLGGGRLRQKGRRVAKRESVTQRKKRNRREPIVLLVAGHPHRYSVRQTRGGRSWDSF